MPGRLPTNRRITPRDLYDAYNEGLPGSQQNPRTLDEFWESQPDPWFSDCCPHLTDSHKRVPRALLWRSRELYDPGAFGHEAQKTGDCVSHGSRSCRAVSRTVEIHIKGEPEIYYKRGATEPTYGARGHGGQGMDPAKASRFERDYGFLYRENYPDLGINLTKYNVKVGMGWGRRGVPEKVKNECRKNNVGRYVRAKTLEQALDLFANGYACHSGQSWGTSRNSPRNGINTKSGSWNHDMASVGYDLTSEIFPKPVIFVPNSWGSWNSRNQKWDESILGPWIKGMIVVSTSEWARYFLRYSFFYSDVNQYPAKELPKWGHDFLD